MSDYWRRATAVPSTLGHGSPYGSQMNVVLPPNGLNASQMRNPHLEPSPHYPSPPNPNDSHTRDSVMYEYDEARRTYMGILQRERAELDTAKHEVDALSYEKQSLRKNLAEAEQRAAAAGRERDIANAKVISDTASLRAQVSQAQSEAASLRDELNRVQQAYTSTLLERSQYEALVANLRAEVMAAGRTIVDQTGTIRSLTHEMSRRDPYHLIKERREQQVGGESVAPSNAAEVAKLQATIGALEGQVKKLQAEVAERALGEAKAREELAVSKGLLDSKVAGAADAFRANEASLRAQVKALEADFARVRQAAIEAASEADKSSEEARAAKMQGESDRQLAADLGRQLDELKKGVPAEDIKKPLKATVAQTQLDEERKKYESKIGENLNTIRDASQQLRAANTTISQLEHGTLPTDLKDAVYVDVEIAVISGEKLIDRDPKNKGLLDPFVRLLDVIGDKIVETDPCMDTNSPKFDPAKSSGRTRIARSGKGSIRLEVWAKVGPSDPEVFLGMATVSAASLIDGGNSQRTVNLQPRPDESDEVIIQNAKALGSITFSVQQSIAGSKVPAAAAPAPSRTQPVPPAASSAAPQASTADKTPAARAVTPPPPPPVVREQPKTDLPQDVLFHIVGCDRVIHRDLMGSKSDPYVLLLRDGATKPLYKSGIKSSTDAPRWLPDATGSVTVPVTRTETAPFVFQVWDDDVGNDEFLGEAKMTAADILSGSGTRTLELCPRNNEPDEEIAGLRGKLGTITINVTIVSAASTKDKTSTAAVAPDGTTIKPSASEIKAVSTGPAQKMLIYVSKCSNLLKNSGFMSNTDPYVEIVGPTGETKVTPTVPKTENPTWKPSAEASMQTIIAPSDESFFTFNVLDDDKVAGIGSIRFCGQAQVTCNELLALGEGTHTFPLKPRKNEPSKEIVKNASNLGTITVTLSPIYSRPGGESAGAADAGTGVAGAAAAVQQLPQEVDDFREVIFTVLEAKDVLARNVFKGSDIFVAINGVDGKEKHRTLTRDNTTHATWSEAEGKVTMLLSPSQREHCITLDVWDYETTGSDHYLGHLKIPVPRIFALNGQTKTEKLTNNPAKKDSKVDENKDKLGTVTFKVSISGFSADQMSSMMVGEISNRRAPPSTTQPFNAKIWVKGCTNLRNRQVNGEVSDPFVVIKDTLGREHSTPTIDNTLSPQWTVIEGSMMTTINPQDATGVIVFDVRDVGYLNGMKPMGSARILIKDLIKQGLGERTFQLGAGPKENDAAIHENEGKLGTITVDIVPDDGAAATPAVAAAPGGSANSLTAHSAGTNPVPCTVRVLCGQQLLKRHTVSSPQVEAFDSSNQLMFTTPTIKENLNPVWSGQPNTSKEVKLSPLDGGDLSFKVFDDNPKGRGAMGVARIPIKSLFTGTSTRFTIPVGPSATENDPLVLASKGSLGSLQIEVTPAASVAPAASGVPLQANPAAPVQQPPQPTQPTQPAGPKRMSILVKVKAGKDLEKGDTFTSDCIVRIIKNGEQIFQSDCEMNTLNPVWANAKATVNITVPSSDEIKLHVLDRDKHMMGDDTFDDIGSCTLSAAEIATMLGSDQELALTLPNGKKKGKLIVNFSQE